jgi:hypothetical protein
MNSIEKHVVERLQSAQIERDPFPHFYVNDVFPQDFYDNLLVNMPSDDEFLCHDPYRFTLSFDADDLARLASDRRVFWEKLYGWMSCEVFKYSIATLVYPDLRLRFFEQPDVALKSTMSLGRNKAGFILGPHTDMPHRVFTLIFYLPKDDLNWETGTSLYRSIDSGFSCPGGPHHGFDNFIKLATIKFLPNMAFGFFKSDNSFHGVEPWLNENFVRDTLQFEIHDADRAYYYG